MNKSTHIKGFTMIEMIIAIALMFILFNHSTMSFVPFTESGKFSASSDMAKTICDAQKMYFAKHSTFASTATLVNEEYIIVKNAKYYNGSEFVDAWGRPFIISSSANSYSIKLSSASQSKFKNILEFSAP